MCVCVCVLPSLFHIFFAYCIFSDSGSTLIDVPSTHTNLRSLAVALLSNCPVLLEGAVGAGKTTLVEHLAQVCGRTGINNSLLKIQMGDQTDSKALLGTYVCTSTPGVFKYQPGVLVEALTKGMLYLMLFLPSCYVDFIHFFSVTFLLCQSLTLHYCRFYSFL